MKCPICQSPSPQFLLKDDRPYYKCEKCEFLFHRPEEGTNLETITSFYDSAYWQMERAEALRREREDCFLRAVELIFLSSIPVKNILDFGCGVGITVDLLRKKLGLNAVGVDISADFEETPYLHKCELATLVNRYPENSFDAIYSIEVFEHLEDPVRTLSLLAKLLKPGGKILINTGTLEYMERYDPEMTYIDPLRRGHISIYSLKSMAELAATIGYSADFVADRVYELVLSPANNSAPFPNPENLQALKKFGDWLPALWQEYMRLVYLEKEFSQKCAWIAALERSLNKQTELTAALRSQLQDSRSALARLEREHQERKV